MGLKVLQSATTGITMVSDDTSPQLGGELDTNGNDIDMGSDSLTDGVDSVDFDNIQGATKGQIEVTFDGGGSALTTGAKKVYIQVPYTGTITSARLLADQSGDLVVDIWNDTYANFPPTVADTITAAAKPTLSTALKSEDTTLTGWTPTVSKGDILEFNIDSIATITKAILLLEITKTDG